MHFQAHYTFDPGGEIQFIIGGGAAYKEIVPELATGQGYVNNLVEGTNVTGLGTDIHSLYRVSPRIVLNSGKTRFALEGEYTGARFGSVNTSENRRGIPLDPEEVNNLRLLLGVYLFF